MNIYEVICYYNCLAFSKIEESCQKPERLALIVILDYRIVDLLYDIGKNLTNPFILRL